MNPSENGASVRRAPLAEAATRVCLLFVVLAVTAFSGTWFAQSPEKPKRNLLFIGQAKGYQHESISTAMATLHNLGRSSGLWNTYLRTDCTAISPGSNFEDAALR